MSFFRTSGKIKPELCKETTYTAIKEMQHYCKNNGNIVFYLFLKDTNHLQKLSICGIIRD